MTLDATQIGLAAGAEALGVIVQGSVGFGLNVVAAPLLLLIDTRFVPVPSLITGLLVTSATAYRERASIDRVRLTWALGGRVPGTLAGALALFVLTRRSTEDMFGCVVLGAVVLSLIGWRIQPRWNVLMGVGMLSGFMGTTAAIGGPPLALVYQRDAGPTVRGTLSAFGFGGAALSLVTLALFGEIHANDLLLTVALVPGLAFGYLVARRVSSKIDGRWVQPVVLGVVTLSAIIVLVQGLGGGSSL